jgi:uncharacterized protein (DUF2249 family)
MDSPSPVILDARAIPCAGKHALIFRQWAKLTVGESFVLLNDHRPDPLHRQFEQLVPGCFEWAEIPPPPGAFAVRLTRLHPDPIEFEASLVNGCLPMGERPNDATGISGIAADDGILVRLHLDFRDYSADEARERILNLAQGLREGTELLADLRLPDPSLDQSLTLLARVFRGAAIPDPMPGWRYAIRHPD